jgi:hypothetical protein
MSSSFIAFGSTKEKAVSRVLGRGCSADGHAVLPIAGCVCTAVTRDGKPHVMSVSFPATPGVPEQCFAFATSKERDWFMRALQAKSISLAAPSTSAPTHVAAEAHNAVGGEALAKVNLPHAAKLLQTLQRATPSAQEPVPNHESQLTYPAVHFLTDLRRRCGSIHRCCACGSSAAVEFR